MTYLNRLLAVTLATLSLSALAAPQVTVGEAWVRGTVAAQKATGAFMQLTSLRNARLVEARSPVAGVVEIHQMEMSGDTMVMRQVAGLDLPAGKMVELKPGGFHIMLLELKGQVKAGDKVPLTLVVEGSDKKRETIEVNAIARPLSSAGAMHH
ncbi:copper chaperone PCu(A)C [Janthinobacterium agaricidamnosum]|uniref:Copper chaperone PCu(A)C n=1 Tax=Janthinobacterium agaricidamnosum NBRC 102515 = DSM 9628 TaxID=1349767 RepID=W0V6Y4_9BURK|nr:copper chaperone PCu(A)C [Janthinobacterium agaricidamnosum]CDG83641.1 conserved hypothetical protein [Janthinobacterium agaricidamnosum NBRC 102515 = DSM 9628]